MPKAEADILIECGVYWNHTVWIRGDIKQRDKLIEHVNEALTSYGYKLGRGRQDRAKREKRLRNSF